uniref:Uncharacterized protein n=1 Tax=Strigamia maritima TaxID=126957 RepID=T1JFB3_STRMM
MGSILKLPSLKHMTLARLSVLLCQCNFTFYEYLKETTVDKNKQWLEVETTIFGIVDGFSIPNHLKPMLCTLVSHVGRELLDAVTFLICQVFNSDTGNRILMKSIISGTKWTIYGKLDIRRTAKVLSQSQDLTDQNRLDIACVCCIADVVKDLYIPNTTEYILINLNSLMFYFWKDIKSGDPIEMTYDKKCAMLTISMTHKNQSAVEYFWSLMSNDERNELIINLIQQNYDISDELNVIIDNAADYFNEESFGIPKNDYRYPSFPTVFTFTNGIYGCGIIQTDFEPNPQDNY